MLGNQQWSWSRSYLKLCTNSKSKDRDKYGSIGSYTALRTCGNTILSVWNVRVSGSLFYNCVSCQSHEVDTVSLSIYCLWVLKYWICFRTVLHRDCVQLTAVGSLHNFAFFFDVLLTVHPSIFISVINQLDAQNVCFTINLFHASTCFEHMCSKHVEAWNKLIVKQKFCASSWLIAEINTILHVF